MPEVGGGCYCGNIRLVVAFSRELSAYHPRACDCDFCQKHGALYVSDPQGELTIQIHEPHCVSHFRQGSNTAEMLLCRTCGVLVGAVYREPDQVFGTVNAQALDCRAAFGPAQIASPKSLSADQKVTRWRDLWFRNVVFTGPPLPDTPVLQTDRLLLRPLRLEDAPAAQRYFPRWEIVQWLSAIVPWPYPSNGAESYIRSALEQRARDERFIWAICLKAAPDGLIGVLELRPDDGSRDQRGFWLATEYQGRGLITEAADRITEYAFETLGWPHLWLINAQGNIPSRRIKQRQGATLVDTIDRQFVSGLGKAEVWLLRSEDWAKSRRSSGAVRTSASTSGTQKGP
jgi:ribosomal-protein-alanine N-acetyltransferase